MSINTLDHFNFQSFEYRFELTSDAFNSRLTAVENATDAIVDKLNELITATEDVYPATAISFESVNPYAWLNATNVAQAIAALATKYGNHNLLYDTGDVHRDHREIDHSGIPGIAAVDQDKYNELVSGNSTTLHRHDDMYLTKTQLASLGISDDYLRLIEVGAQNNLAISANNSYTQEHGLTQSPDFMVAVFQPTGSTVFYYLPLVLSKNGSDYIGIEVTADDTNVYITTGSIILPSSSGDITSGTLSIRFYVRL